MKRFWIMRGLKVLFFAAVFISLAGLVTRELWNALVPDIFGLPVITWTQALGLLVLGRLLFGFGGGPKGGGFKPKNDFWDEKNRQSWKEKLTHHWEKMDPEQRERFRQRWERHRGDWDKFREANPAPNDPEKETH